MIAPQGPAHIERLIAQIEDPNSSVPQSARTCFQVLVDTLRALRERIDRLDAEIAVRAKQDDAAQAADRAHSLGRDLRQQVYRQAGQ